MKTGCENCNLHRKGFFCGQDHQVLSDVLQNKIEKKFKRGQVILLEGQPARGLYCIKGGKIKIIKKFNDGKEAIIHIASVGDLIGHYSAFNDQTYSSSAVALEETHVCFIEKKFMLNTIKKHPKLALTLIKKFCEEITNNEKRFTSIIQRNVRERMAHLLVTLSEAFGIVEENGLRLDIKLTRDEMASMIGSVNESVIRCMTEFKDEELIEEDGKKIYIINEAKLKKFANYTAEDVILR